MDSNEKAGPAVKKPQQNKSVGLSRRLHFPEDEHHIPWLSRLLDAYAVADTGVVTALRDAVKKKNKKLACSKGCDAVAGRRTSRSVLMSLRGFIGS
jgi:hypothetical protein